ncbi:MAG: hypothetical protein J6X93_02515 [Bacilli bacterium]|nr:hypothetical protein [Bacilli bacterium]
MMRFLKAKFIIPALIVILAVIVVLLYFVGALKANAKSFDNIPFDLSKFVVASEQETLNKNKKIAENANFIMYFDEDTTVVTIEDKTTHKLYTTAIPSEANAEGEYVAEGQDTGLLDSENNPILENVDKKSLMSNFILYYIKKDGKESGSSLNVIENSVAFKNELIGEYERHYSFYENQEEGLVQVCYDIGKFSSISAYFPSKAKKTDWDDLIRGNIRFEERITSQKETGYISYTGRAYCYGDDILEYLQNNDLLDYETEPRLTDPKEREYLVTLNPDNLLYDTYGTYLNCEGSPLKYNPFISYNEWEFLSKTYYQLGVSDTIVDENGEAVRYYGVDKMSTNIARELYNYLYTKHIQTVEKVVGSTTETVQLKYDNGEYVYRGGFHARDEEGNYLYETDEEGNLVPVQGFYNVEMVEEQDIYFGVDADVTLPVFRVALQFKLTEKGLEVSVIHDSLLDSSNWTKDDNKMYNGKCKIARIEMAPMLASSYVATDGAGQIILPDGSGSVIEFNNHAEDRGASAYNHTIYGPDEVFLVNNQTAQTPDLMFPMFGFLDNASNKGVMGVVKKGANLSSIVADSNRSGTPYNYVKFTTYIREIEKLELAYGWYRYKIDKWAEYMCPTDIVYDYWFIKGDDLNYSSLAKVYQSYLCAQYNILPSDATDKTVVNLNMVGAYRHYQLTLGIIYYKKSALTSFEQAEEIVQELIDNGVDKMAISYKGWTQDALEYKLRRNFSISSALGGKKDMQDLSAFFASKGIDFYPELNISTNKGYKLGFGNSKYTARGVGNVAAKEYAYDLSKNQYDKKSKPTYLVSPKFYTNISEVVSKSFAKTNANGIYLIDLGNEKIGDYRKSNPIYAEANKYYQIDAMNYWKENGYKVQLNRPFDYAIGSASSIVGAPLTTTLDPIINYTIPFYELVLSGIVDYSMEIINGTNDYSVEWYLAKAAETGSNLYFQVAYKDNSILLETDYTQYYRVHFEQWKDTIIDMTTRLNQLGIHGGHLVKHESINVNGLTIAKVEYSNGIKLYVNTNSRDVIYDGKTIKAYSWYKL